MKTRPQGSVPERRSRPWLLEFWGSQLGKKYVMALTGIVIFGWVFMHMIGNLKVFQGAAHMNDYSAWLREFGEPAAPTTGLLWLIRFVLLGALVGHIVAAAQLTLTNRRARTGRYRSLDYTAADYASRTMRWSGVIVGLFIVYHLLDFTTGTVHPDFVLHDPYHNVVAAFQRWPVSAVYILANLALGLHLYHGLWSLFQSMGWNNRRFNQWRRYFAVSFAAIVTLGYISVPIAVMAGVVT